MKILSRIILIISIGLISYGYWGAFTTSGNKVYDEMDGFIPFFIFILGLILLIVFLTLEMIRRRKKKTGPHLFL